MPLASGFTVPPRRAIIEGTLDWLTCYRRYTFIRGQLIARLRLLGTAHLHLIARQDLGYRARAQPILMSTLPR
jgi:hypothetical protein